MQKKIFYIILLLLFSILLSLKLFEFNNTSISYLSEKYLNKIIELKFHILFNLLISIFVYADLVKKKINYFYFSVLIFSLLFGYQISTYIGALGPDSFFTILGTNKNEIKFFIKSLKPILTPDKYNLFLTLNNLILFLAIITLNIIKDISLLINFANKQRLYLVCIFFSLILIKFSYNIYQTIQFDQNLKKNFTDPKIKKNNVDIRDIQLVLYIGESTTTMNMGVYNYFRKTTPFLTSLDKNGKIIKFNKVFSNHTHSGPSIISSLSFIENDSEINNHIYNQKRISIIDILKKFNIKTEITTYDNTHPIYKSLFKNAIVENDSESKVLPSGKIINYFDNISYDKNFKEKIIESRNKKLLIFHSYAGHGPYKNSLPEKFRIKVDNFFKNKNKKTIFGNANVDIENVEDYDMAISYIDSNLNEVINDLNKTKFPKILIYFSDHGESVYTGRAHDSSRYIHEMSRVPLILYFNDAAKIKFQRLYNIYNNSLNKNYPVTLGQLPSTILDLFGIQLLKKNFLIPSKIGDNERNIEFPVLKKSDEDFSLNLNKVVDKTKTNKQHIFFVNNLNSKKVICYHRSNSVGKILRGNMLGNCLESDLTYLKKDNSLIISHFDKTSSDHITFAEYLKIAKTEHLWIDIKNNFNLKICKNLKQNLINSSTNSKIYFEIRLLDYSISSELQKCANDLLNYNDSKFIINLSNLGSVCENNSSCYKLKVSNITSLLNKVFLGISYKNFLDEKNNLNNFDKYNFFVWSVKLEDVEDIKQKNINFIAVDSYQDPNNF